MTIIKRFFDTATAEPATQVADAPRDVNIAEMMAKHGVHNDTDSPVATPIDIEEKTEPKKEEVVTPAETATESQTQETAKVEPQKVQPEATPVPEPQKAAEPVKAPTLQEVLKNHQPDTVLKELGLDDQMVKLVNDLKTFDPKVIGLVQAYKEGKHIEYLRELTTDYTKMSAEDVMRHQLGLEYPKASDKALEVLFRKEVLEKYNLDSTDPAEAEEGRLLLDAKADRYRDEFTANQEKYLVPKAPEPKAAEPDKEAEQQKQEFVDYRNKLTADPYTTSLFTNKKIIIGEGDSAFKYTVEPQEMMDVLFKADSWMASVSNVIKNDDGTVTLTPKAEHQMLVAAVAKYGKPFLDEYAKHFKSLGGKAVTDSIDNAKQVDTTQTSTPDAAPKNAAEAMARGGQYTQGGYNR